jgi:glutamate/tyrosine decarboxylase-like PLP-dependent enzyme
VENSLIKWLANLLGFPKTAAGSLVSGGSTANFTAITAARDAHFPKSHEFAKAVVYLSAHTHYCCDKALHLAGLGDAIKRRVPLDRDFRMIPEALERMIEEDKASNLKPWLLIATAGTTDLGSVDPLHALSKITKKHKLWFHVDAAYGGFFILTEEGRKLFAGINEADSVVLDPHKSLFLPYGLGIVVVRDRKTLLHTFNYEAPYLKERADVDEEMISPSTISPELTSPFRGLRMWLPLHLLGVAPFRAALEEKLLLAKYFYENVQKLSRIEMASSPQLSIVVFRYVPRKGDANAINIKWLETIRHNSQAFLSGTNINGTIYIRFACLSFRTHLEIVNHVLDFLKQTLPEE